MHYYYYYYYYYYYCALCCFVVYLTKLSVTQAMYCRTVG
jgi:hypothetical protein